MSYNIVNMALPSGKYSLKSPYSMSPKYIVVHNTANDASARNEITYMRNNSASTSFHVAIDDKEVVTSVPFNRNAWHAGDGSNGKGNRYGIGIEICYSKSGGDKFDQAEQNAAKYIAALLNQYGWGIDRVISHKDCSGKYCPHRTLDKGWTRFKNMINAELTGSDVPAAKTGSKNTAVKTATTSDYKAGQVKTLQAAMKVRNGAGLGAVWKLRSQLTADGKKHAQNGRRAVLKKGTRVTILSVVCIGKDVWLKIPSGYVCAKLGNKIYIK